jgi:hypothetical protein
MVSIIWNDRKIAVFVVDILDRGEELKDAAGEDSAKSERAVS